MRADTVPLNPKGKMKRIYSGEINGMEVLSSRVDCLRQNDTADPSLCAVNSTGNSHEYGWISYGLYDLPVGSVDEALQAVSR